MASHCFKKHVFVCTEGKICPNQGSLEVFTELRQALAASEYKEGIRINKAGCLSQCGKGPMVVIYPEGIWYSQVAVSDCQEIVGKHLGNNEVVERLLLK